MNGEKTAEGGRRKTRYGAMDVYAGPTHDDKCNLKSTPPPRPLRSSRARSLHPCRRFFYFLDDSEESALRCGPNTRTRPSPSVRSKYDVCTYIDDRMCVCVCVHTGRNRSLFRNAQTFTVNCGTLAIGSPLHRHKFRPKTSFTPTR